MVQAGRLESKVRRQLLLNVALPLAYVICGRLGLLLAMPPGFATAVFLPRMGRPFAFTYAKPAPRRTRRILR
jgi:hypothetical protein